MADPTGAICVDGHMSPISLSNPTMSLWRGMAWITHTINRSGFVHPLIVLHVPVLRRKKSGSELAQQNHWLLIRAYVGAWKEKADCEVFVQGRRMGQAPDECVLKAIGEGHATEINLP